MRHTTSFRTTLLLIGFMWILTACGGGGDKPAAETIRAVGLVTVDEACTLVDAITAAITAQPVGECAVLSADGIIALSADVVLNDVHDSVDGSSGLPSITRAITIDGGGFTIRRVDGGKKFRIFHVGAGGHLTLDNVTLKNGLSAAGEDGAGNAGGAIYVAGGKLTLSNSTLYGNKSKTGGGLYVAGGTVEITRSTLSANVAEENGGAIYTAAGTVTITESTLTGNVATDNGGGIFASGGTVTITASTLDVNQSNTGGGAIVNNTGSTVNLTNCTLSGNASGSGGGVFNNGGTLLVTNCTLSGNHLDSITNMGGVVTVVNTILAKSSGQDCREGGGRYTGSDNRDTDGKCPDSARIFGLKDFMAKNGGPTQTHALLSGSTAIDVGFLSSCPPTDQRGANRVDRCDIGAFEYGGQFDTDKDTILDVADNCLEVANVAQTDSDADGAGDACDQCPGVVGTVDGCPDGDGDGVKDSEDNCLTVPNKFQTDSDENGAGDACQDSDVDGIVDGEDNCPLIANSDQGDFNGDEVGDACQDSDGDGVMDADDGCPTDPSLSEIGACLFTGTVSNNVNLRQGPGTGYGVAVVLNANEAFNILGRNAGGDWLRIRTRPADGAEAVEGWVFANLVTTDAEIETLPELDE